MHQSTQAKIVISWGTVTGREVMRQRCLEFGLVEGVDFAIVASVDEAIEKLGGASKRTRAFLMDIVGLSSGDVRAAIEKVRDRVGENVIRVLLNMDAEFPPDLMPQDWDEEPLFHWRVGTARKDQFLANMSAILEGVDLRVPGAEPATPLSLPIGIPVGQAA